MAQPMSLPARSDMRNGPIAMPQLSTARSTCLGVAPSSNKNNAWRMYCSTMRLPMKPSHTPETTAVFLIFFARAITVARTSLAVFAPRTTSRSFITLAGLKKCVPTTSWGRRVKSAILFTSSAEEIHRDAPAHGTRADDRDLLDLAQRRVLRHVGNLRCRPFAEEGVPQRTGFRGLHQLQERFTLEPCPLFKI